MYELLAFILVALVTMFLLMTQKIYSIFINSKPTGRKTILSTALIVYIHRLHLIYLATISLWKVRIVCFTNSVSFVIYLGRIIFGPLPYYSVLFYHYWAR